jgi:hypothetical protein
MRHVDPVRRYLQGWKQGSDNISGFSHWTLGLRGSKACVDLDLLPNFFMGVLQSGQLWKARVVAS